MVDVPVSHISFPGCIIHWLSASRTSTNHSPPYHLTLKVARWWTIWHDWRSARWPCDNGTRLAHQIGGLNSILPKYSWNKKLELQNGARAFSICWDDCLKGLAIGSQPPSKSGFFLAKHKTYCIQLPFLGSVRPRSSLYFSLPPEISPFRSSVICSGYTHQGRKIPKKTLLLSIILVG